MRNPDLSHCHESPADRVLKCLQGAASCYTTCYMTQAEIAEATRYGAKAIAWAVFLLRQKGLIKGRQRDGCLEYRATLTKDVAPIPKSLKTVGLRQGLELSPVPEGSIEGARAKPNPVGTTRLRQGFDRSAIPEGPCGAKIRAGTPCKQKAVYWNGRCKFHGGLSTGPKTDAGKEQARINGTALANPADALTCFRSIADQLGIVLLSKDVHKSSGGQYED